MTIAESPEVKKKESVPAPESRLFSLESEKLLLSAILNEGKKDLAHGLLAKVAPTDFHMPVHATIWRTAMTLHDNRLGHDAVAIIDHSRTTQSFIGGAEFIFNLAEDPIASTASPETLQSAAARVKDFSVRRNLKAVLEAGLKACDSSGDEHEQILSMVEDNLLNLRKSSETSKAGPTHIREGLNGLMDRIQRQMDGEKIGVGITTGFADLDEITSGLINEDFIILAARPSMGKTAMALNLARNGAVAGQPSLIFSLEMKEQALAQRLLGRESRVQLQSLRTASLDGADSTSTWERLSDGVMRLSEYPIYIDDTPGLTINEIRSRSRTFVAEHGQCTIYVDYIQHVARREQAGGKQQDERTHVSSVSAGLKGMARELKVPVVGLSQLNRKLEDRANKRPGMADLSESGSLEQDADLILFLYRDERYNPDTQDKGLCEVIIGKQRDGAVGVVKLVFQNEIGMFSDFQQGGY